MTKFLILYFFLSSLQTLVNAMLDSEVDLFILEIENINLLELHDKKI